MFLKCIVVALVGATLYIVKLLILPQLLATWLTWTLDLTTWLDSEVMQHVCKVLMSVVASYAPLAWRHVVVKL